MQELTSVVVVTADSGPLLQASIDSVMASTTPAEIIVVDNASSDGEVERMMRAHADKVRLLRNDANLGFGPACNRGAALARGDVLLFLNPDCEIEPETIAGMRALLGRNPRVGLLGVTVCAEDGTPARGNRRRDPTLSRALATLSGLARCESRWPRFAGIEMPALAVPSALERVEAVSGACMALPRSVFEQVGGFDEGYFLHVEDLDLCRRVREAGYDVVVAHDLRVRHRQGSSSHHRALFVAKHKHRGMWRYFRKFDPAARNPVMRVVVWLGIWGHFALVAVQCSIRGFGRS